MAEWAGFEPALRVYPVGQFSKLLVSASHPPLRMRQLPMLLRAEKATNWNSAMGGPQNQEKGRRRLSKQNI